MHKKIIIIFFIAIIIILGTVLLSPYFQEKYLINCDFGYSESVFMVYDVNSDVWQYKIDTILSNFSRYFMSLFLGLATVLWLRRETKKRKLVILFLSYTTLF